MPWLLALVILLLGAVVWTARDELRSWLPSTELNQLLERGDQALADEHLNGAQGTSARELYSAALAIAPDSEHARRGLQQVGEAQFKRAQDALEAGDLQSAANALAEARVLLGGGAELDALAKQLAGTRGRNTEVALLIERADTALAQGRVNGAGGAGALYSQALKADPDNAVAAHGLQKVAASYAEKIRTSLREHDLPRARDGVQALNALLPDNGALPGLRAALAQAERDAKATLMAMLDKAQLDLEAGRLIGAGDNNALARFRKVLGADPGNAAAAHGIDQVAAALLLRARTDMESGRVQAARSAIDAAAEVRPNLPAVAAARSQLAQLQRQQSTLPSAPTVAQKAKVAELVLRAQAAASAGDLMLPPGSSAYDLYRAALAIDPDNTDALAGLADLPGQARRLFDAAIDASELKDAAALLKTFSELLPSSSSVAHLQERLGSAWLDQGIKLMQAGNASAAQHALAEGRRLTPNDPRVLVLEKRLGG